MLNHTYKVLEFDEFHEYCPFGFDTHIDDSVKTVTLEICTQNEVLDDNMFWQTFEEEIQAHVNGENEYL
jgi:hypothetical protein